MITPAVQPGNLKKALVKGSKILHSLEQKSDFTRKDDSTIKGKREGIITPEQRNKPSLTPLDTTLGYRKRQNAMTNIIMYTGILINLFFISLRIYMPPFLQLLCLANGYYSDISIINIIERGVKNEPQRRATNKE